MDDRFGNYFDGNRWLIKDNQEDTLHDLNRYTINSDITICKLLNNLDNEISNLKNQLQEKDRQIELIKNVKAKEVANVLSNIANALSDTIREKLDTATALDFIRAANADKTQSIISELEDILRFVNRQIMITTTNATELDMAEAKGCNDVVHDVADKITGRLQVLKGDIYEKN